MEQEYPKLKIEEGLSIASQTQRCLIHTSSIICVFIEASAPGTIYLGSQLPFYLVSKFLTLVGVDKSL